MRRYMQLIAIVSVLTQTTSGCELITTPLCKGLPYNETQFPNLLGHTDQGTAAAELHQYLPLVKIQCSPSLQRFLCLVFIPACTELQRPIPPCQSLCFAAQNGCETLMNRFGFYWPENLNCSRFPIDNNEKDMCISDPSQSTTTLPPIELIEIPKSLPARPYPHYYYKQIHDPK